jgi:hypothetical protein
MSALWRILVQMAAMLDALKLNKAELEPIRLKGSWGMLWARALKPISRKFEFSAFLPIFHLVANKTLRHQNY